MVMPCSRSACRPSVSSDRSTASMPRFCEVRSIAVSVSASLRFRLEDEEFTQAIDGIDTTRARGKLMLYTPRFGPDSDMADTGVEWQLSGTPLTVTDKRPNAGRTPIPPGGVVL